MSPLATAKSGHLRSSGSVNGTLSKGTGIMPKRKNTLTEDIVSALSGNDDGSSEIVDRVEILEAFQTFVQNKMMRQDKELANVKIFLKGFEQFQTLVEKTLITQQKENANLRNKVFMQWKEIADLNKKIRVMNEREAVKEAQELKDKIREMERDVRTYKDRLNLIEGCSGNEADNVLVSPVTPASQHCAVYTVVQHGNNSDRYAQHDVVDDGHHSIGQCKAPRVGTDNSSDNDFGTEAHVTLPVNYMQGAQPDCSSEHLLNEK